ncbi:MAG: YciI family protein [Kofleriaceae bacterium]
MQYLCLIYDDETKMDAMPDAEKGAFFAEYMKFSADVKASGHMVAGDALQPVATATTVRIRDGKLTTTDGPFAETREQLGGYYLIEAKDLDEAIQIAARIPSARYGSIEVRPVMVFDGP